MKLVLFLDGESFSEEDMNSIRYLFSDALIDFKARRADGDAKAYVEARYPHMSEKFKDKKILEVRSRIDLASRLHNVCLEPEVV